MLIFGHVGITTAVIKLYEKAAKIKNPKDNNFIDYRIVMVGSVLPDIIDKPLIQIIYGLKSHDGHFIAHSLIFSGWAIVIGIIILIINTNKSVFLLGICSLIHQIFDKMMVMPNVFFLPNVNSSHFIVLKRLEFIHNVTIPIYTRSPYLRDVVIYFEKPYVFISEVIGIMSILYFVCKLFINKGYIKFLKYGRL